MEIPRLPYAIARFLGLTTDAPFADHLDWLAPDHYDPGTRSIFLSHHSWLLDTGAHKILIDPCIGNHKPRKIIEPYNMLKTPWLDRLAAAGVRPEDIDVVFCTHLHPDHCGWNTRLVDGRWVPTFPNAAYYISKRENEYWGREVQGVALPADEEFNSGVYGDSVLPVVQAGQARIIDDREQTVAGLRVIPTPGHTIGHLGAVFESDREGVVFAGDTLHHPLQVVFPDWNTRSCYDSVRALASRRRVLDLVAERNFFLAPAHFCGSHVCRVSRNNDSYNIHW